MNDIAKFKNSQSASFRRLNPHLFGDVGASQTPERKCDTLSALEQKPKVLNRDQDCVAVRVVICRFFGGAGRSMDSDNLQTACKPLRDAIAESLGVDDADPRLDWEYLQIKSSGSPGVLVKIEAR